MAATQRYREYAGYRTRMLEVGSGRRRSKSTRLVLVHGYCDSADTWRPVLDELAEAGHDAAAVDLPGFGEADPLRRGAILPQLDAFIAALVRDQARHGKVVLAGNSLGGTVSVRAAQNSALPITGVASIAAPGFADSWLVRTVGRYPLPLRLGASLPLPVPRFVVRAIAYAVVPRLLYAQAATADADQVRRFTALFPDYRSTTRRLEQARELVIELADAYQPDAVTAPLLVVACGRDRLVTTAAGRALHALVPHSRLLVREDWGHCPQLDDPATIAELLSYFAASSARGAAPSRAQRLRQVRPRVRRPAPAVHAEELG